MAQILKQNVKVFLLDKVWVRVYIIETMLIVYCYFDYAWHSTSYTIVNDDIDKVYMGYKPVKVLIWEE